MSNEFKKLTERLAKGLNFPSGAVILITREPGRQTIDTVFKGNSGILTRGLCMVIAAMIKELPDKYALEFREMLKREIIEDEQRRFQATDMGD